MWTRHDTIARMGQSHLAGKSPASVLLTITLLLRLFISSSTRISHHLWGHFYPGVKETMVLPASSPTLNKRLCAPFSLIITVNRVAVCSPTRHFLPHAYTNTFSRLSSVPFCLRCFWTNFHRCFNLRGVFRLVRVC